jgi:branched-chain amino acid transport system permease protein
LEPRNRDIECYALFDARTRQEILRLITPEIIEEHRGRPVGKQSDELARVINYFRRAPLEGKYAVHAVNPLGPYKILALSSVRGVKPRLVTQTEYPTIDSIYHAIFLMRVADLKAIENPL